MQRKSSLNPCTSVRGASLLAAITAMAMLSLTMFASMAYLDLLTTQNASLKQDFSISLVKTNIIRNLQSPSSWVNTVNDSANLFLACTADPANCLAVKSFVPLNIHDIENKVVVAGAVGSWYDYTGKICPAESTCPVQVKAQWRGVCNNEGTCTQAYVELDFLIRDKSGTQSKSKVSFLKNYFIGTSTSTMTTNVTVNSGALGNAKAKIIVILDSSESMIDNFAKVKSGLSGVMTKLAGKNVEVYFYTTASYEPEWYVTYASNTPLKVYYDDLSQYNGFKKVASFDVKKEDDIHYTLDLSMDMSRKIGLPIDPALDSATVLSRMDSIFATYVAASWSDRESGLCTLHRILTDEGPNKVINSNDLAFFILVSDENDVMMTSESMSKYGCHKKQTIEMITTTTSQPQDCNPSLETCDFANARLYFGGIRALIGYSEVKNDTQNFHFKTLCDVNTDYNYTGYKPCPFSTLGKYACTDSQMKIINPDGSNSILSCYVAVENDSRNYTISSQTPATMATMQSNFCTGGSFTLSGVTYVNLQDYIQRAIPGFASANLESCQVSFTKMVPMTGTYPQATSYTRMNGDITTTKIFTSEEQLKMRDHIISNLKAKFGTTGFAVKAIIQDPIKDLGLCSLTNGSYGTVYVDFLNALGSPLSSYDSICNSSYDVSFDTLSSNILSKINNTYIFSNMTSDDKIVGINITRAGSSFTLDPTRYEVVSNKVIFQEGALQEGDQITLLLNNGTTGSW
ncbi:hypothetical protein [Bdellovibrio sp. HCB337]|uniref:hypothetical protein n=1 Tax=Bdellovibrio sp. HCB337 TaxID=3394358 RepID=UPI0039A65691